MKHEITIGIWGCGGFVGGTVYEALNRDLYSKRSSRKYFKKKFKVYGYDLDKERSFNTKEETAVSDVVFIAVPTPMMKDGRSYTDIVKSTIKEIRGFREDNLIVIKSTVPPGTTKEMNKEYGRVCFNPEFLTEANALNDFINISYQIIGIPEPKDKYYENCVLTNFSVAELESLFKNAYECHLLKCEKIYIIDSTMAEMVKYTRNCYLATRLSFFNEIKQICDKLNIDYNDMIWFAGLDERIGNHYNKIDPLNPGWGLSCLPKDLNALKFLAKELDINPKVLNAVWEKNLEVRKFRDWEKMEKAVKK